MSLGQSKKKAEQVSYVLALESSIASAIADSSSYTESQRELLRAGQVPSDLQLNVQLPNSPSGTFSAQRGQVVFLNTSLSSCGELDGVDCIYSFQFEVKNKNELLPSLPVTFGVAYQIQMQVENALPLSVGSEAPFDDISDYELEIPPSVYRVRDENGCADDELFVVGLNRLTGSVNCIKRPTNSCATNEVMTGYIVGTNPSLQLQLQVRCQPIQAQVTCPSKYSLQSISLSGYVLSGQCTYAGNEEDSYGSDIVTTSVGQATISACPEDYSVSTASLCEVVRLSNTTANCMYNRYPPVFAAWTSAGGPWANGAQLCSQRRRVTHDPVPTVHMVEDLSTGVRAISTRAGRNMNCQLEVPLAVCGASYSGRVSYFPQCSLDAGFRPTVPASTSF